MKITSGCLKVKDVLHGSGWAEKADQIRIYSGAKYETAECVRAGQVCAVLGLSASFPGQGLGAQAGGSAAVVELRQAHLPPYWSRCSPTVRCCLKAWMLTRLFPRCESSRTPTRRCM